MTSPTALEEAVITRAQVSNLARCKMQIPEADLCSFSNSGTMSAYSDGSQRKERQGMGSCKSIFVFQRWDTHYSIDKMQIVIADSN